MKPVNVQLCGESVVVRESCRPLKNDDGYISNDKGFWELVLSKGLSDHDRLETFLHEALHKQFWYLDEDVVILAAKELANGLETLELV